MTEHNETGEYITVTPSPEMRAAVLAAAGIPDALAESRNPALTADEAEALRGGWLMPSAVAKVSAEMRAYHGADLPAEQHSTNTRARRARANDGSEAPLWFAYCSCGWEGPSRISRTSAIHDANTGHPR